MNRISPSIEPEQNPELNFRDAYRLVAAQVRRLRKARHEIDAELEKAEAALELLGQLSKSRSGGAVVAGSSRNKKHSGKKFHQGSMTFEIVTRAKRILLETGRPLTRSELAERFSNETGFSISANNPARAIGRALWNNPDFFNIPKIGYWIKGTEIPK